MVTELEVPRIHSLPKDSDAKWSRLGFEDSYPIFHFLLRNLRDAYGRLLEKGRTEGACQTVLHHWQMKRVGGGVDMCYTMTWVFLEGRMTWVD